MNEEKTQPLIWQFAIHGHENAWTECDEAFARVALDEDAFLVRALQVVCASPSVNEEKTEAAGGVRSYPAPLTAEEKADCGLLSELDEGTADEPIASDEQILALAHRMAFRFRLLDPEHKRTTYLFTPLTLVQFVRALAHVSGVIASSEAQGEHRGNELDSDRRTPAADRGTGADLQHVACNRQQPHRPGMAGNPLRGSGGMVVGDQPPAAEQPGGAGVHQPLDAAAGPAAEVAPCPSGGRHHIHDGKCCYCGHVPAGVKEGS